MISQALAASPLFYRLGWTLLHSLWQGTAIACLAWIALAAMRRRSPQARYLCACAALLLLVVAPIATYTTIPSQVVRSGESFDFSWAPNVDWLIGVLKDMLTSGAHTHSADLPAERIVQSANPPNASLPLAATTPLAAPWRERWTHTLPTALPYIVIAWLLGVVIFTARNVGGFLLARRLIRREVRPVAAHWQARFESLCATLQLRRAVTLLESTLIEVPSLVGWLKPVILLPASAMTGFTPQQFEAVLAHELAHICRHDYLVNLAQSFIETIFFYHPAAWWLSHRIRTEREYCCDDMVLRARVDAKDYAMALVTLEQARATLPGMVLAFRGGSLLHRVQRILGVRNSEPVFSARAWGGVLSVVALGVAALLALNSTITRAAQEQDQDQNKDKDAPSLSEARIEAIVPTGAYAAFAIPDAGRFWQKVHSLPLGKAIEDYLTSATVLARPAMAQIVDQQAKLSENLGFPATPEEFFDTVFTNLLFYVVPGDRGEGPRFVLTAGVKDEEKAAKVLDVINKNLADVMAASRKAVQMGTALDSFKYDVKEISGFQITHYKGIPPSNSEGYLALVGDRFIYSNSMAGFTQGVTGATTPESSLGGDSGFTKLVSALDWKDAEIEGWFDGDAVSKAIGGAQRQGRRGGPNGRVGRGATSTSDLQAGGAPPQPDMPRVAFTAHALSRGLLAKLATTADPETLSPNAKLSSLTSLRQFSDRPLLVMSSGTFDPEVMLSQFKAMSRGGGGNPMTAILGMFENSIGLSLEKDLVPTVGNELSIGVNSVVFPENSIIPFPTIDLTASIRIKDQELMPSIMLKVEDYLIKRASFLPNLNFDDKGKVIPRAFENMQMGSHQTRTLNTGFPFLSPSYTLVGSQLVIGFNQVSLQNALNRIESRLPTISSSTIYSEMVRHTGGAAKLYSYTVLNVSKLMEMFTGNLGVFSRFMPALNQQSTQDILELILPHVGQVAAVASRQDDIPVTYLRVDME